MDTACDDVFLYDRQPLSNWCDDPRQLCDENDATAAPPCCLCASNDGRHLAILSAGGSVEIRDNHDAFASPVGVCHLSENHVSFSSISGQQMAWNGSGLLLAVCVDSRCLHVLDQRAVPQCSTRNTAGDPAAAAGTAPHDAVVQVMFDSRRCSLTLDSSALTSASQQLVDSDERVLLLSSSGLLKVFNVTISHRDYEEQRREEGDEQCSNNEVSLMFSCCLLLSPEDVSTRLAHVSCATLVSSGSVLVVASGGGGLAGDTRLQGLASCEGLTAWRLIAAPPFVEPCLSDAELDVLSSRHKWLPAWRRWLWSRVASSRHGGSHVLDAVTNLRLSPDGRLLATMHESGGLSVWRVPSLQKLSHWPADFQPHCDAVSPRLLQLSTEQREQVLDSWNLHGRLCDIGWWTSSALVLARHGGAVSVCRLQPEQHALTSLLGDEAEFFGSGPLVAVSAAAPASRVFVLEIEWWRLDVPRDVVVPKPGVFAALGGLVRHSRALLHWLTDWEQFDSRTTTRSRRRATRSASVTSGQLRRLSPNIIEDDSGRDVVDRDEDAPERGWRLCCLRRCSPQQLLTCRLHQGEYGEALALARRFSLDTDSVYLHQWHATVPSVDAVRQHLCRVDNAALAVAECCSRLPATAAAARLLIEHGLRLTEPPSDPHPPQPSMVEARLRLLSHAESLSVFLQLLAVDGRGRGLDEAPDSLFDATQYGRFRDTSPLRSALEFARRGDWRRLLCLLKTRAECLRPWRLKLLSQLPVSMSPLRYAPLLCEIDNRPVYETAAAVTTHHQDWLDKWGHLMTPPSINDDQNAVDCGGMMHECASYAPYLPDAAVSAEIVSEWYCRRAEHIVTASNLPEYGVQLLEMGVANEVDALDALLQRMRTMCTLVYSGASCVNISLRQFSQLPEKQLLQLLTADVDADNVDKLLAERIVPFLQQLPAQQSAQLLADWLVARAETGAAGLQVVARLVDLLISDESEFVGLMTNGCLATAMVRCAAACDSDADTKLLRHLLVCATSAAVDKSAAVRITRATLNRLAAVELLADAFTRSVSVSQLANWTNDRDSCLAVLSSVCRRRCGGDVPVDGRSESGWRCLVADACSLQRLALPALSVAECLDACVVALLVSASQPAHLHLARDVLFSPERRVNLLPSTVACSVDHWCQSPTAAPLLLVTAARELFDWASSVCDPTLHAARQILLLAPGCTAAAASVELQRELALIDSCACVRQLGVEQLLPLKLRAARSSGGRWLLHTCVASVSQRGPLHRHYDQLLQLTKLLQLPGGWQLHHLVAARALAAGEPDTAVKACHALAAECGGASAWPLFVRLAQCDAVDLAQRRLAVERAVRSCPARHLPRLLQVQRQLHELENTATAADASSASRAGTRGIVTTASSVIEATSRTAVSLISLASSAEDQWTSLHADTAEDRHMSTTVDCCIARAYVLPAFYGDLYTGSRRSSNSAATEDCTCVATSGCSWRVCDGRVFSDRDDVKHLSTLLRRALTQDNDAAATVWSQCVDKDWQLVVILAAAGVLGVFRQPEQSLAALYGRALRVLLRQRRRRGHCDDDVFQWTVKRVLVEASRSTACQLSLLLAPVERQLLERQLEAVSRASTVDGTSDVTVDASRFVADAQYQRDLLLPLASTDSSHTAALLWRLSAHCGRQLRDDLAVNHVVFLLAGGVSVRRLRRLMRQRRLAKYALVCGELPALLQARAAETVSGSDWERLDWLYQVLERAWHRRNNKSGGTGTPDAAQQLDEYDARCRLVVLMREHAASCADTAGVMVDFWRVLATDTTVPSHEGHLWALLCAANVDEIATLVARMTSVSVSASLVHSCWVCKCVMHVLSPPRAQHGDSCGTAGVLLPDVLSRLDRHVKTLTAGELEECACWLVFSDRVLDSGAGLTARQQLIAWLQHHAEATQTAESRAVVERLVAWSEHLEYMEWDLYCELATSDDVWERRFARCFDQSRGEDELVMRALDLLVTEGCGGEQLKRCLSVLPMQCAVQPAGAICHAIKTCLGEAICEEDQRADDEEDDVDDERWAGMMTHLDGIGTCIGSCLQSEFFSPQHLASQITQVCDGCNLPARARTRILRRLTRASTALSSCLVEVLHADTQRTLSPLLVHVSPADTQTEVARLRLFERALTASCCNDSAIANLQRIHDALRMWPDFAAEVYADPAVNPVLRVCERLLEHADQSDGQKLLLQLVHVHCPSARLPATQLCRLLERLRAADQLQLSAQLSLCSGVAGMQSFAVQDSCDAVEQGEQWPLQPDWLQCLIDKGVMPLLVGGPLYEVAVSCVSEQQLPLIAQQLRDAGLNLEAARLLVEARSCTTHQQQQQRTLSAVKTAANTIFSRLMQQ